MKDAGYNKAYIWVLDTNERALQAYKKWGGRIDPQSFKNDVIGDCEVQEIMVTFEF